MNKNLLGFGELMNKNLLCIEMFDLKMTIFTQSFKAAEQM